MKSVKAASAQRVKVAPAKAVSPSSLARNPLSVELGANLKRMREARGMTQQNLAHAAEMDRTFVSLCERGATNPSLYSLGTLCWCLKITMAELFAGIEHTLPPSGMSDGRKRRANQASHEPRPPSPATAKRAETMRRKKLAMQDAQIAAANAARKK